MTLRSMQDIGGCRAILKNQKAVVKALRALKGRRQLRVKDYVILEIDIRSERLTLNRFPRDRFDDAAAHYLSVEKSINIDSGKVVVLVSTDAVNGLKEAYPNYFADSATFLHLLKVSIDVYKVSNPSKVSRALKKLFS